MGQLRNSALFSLAAAAHGSKCAPPSKIEWGPCEDLGVNATVPIQCGELTVPLDYTDPECTETLNLQLLKAPAAQQPSQGMIQVNFGGPGATGRDNLAETGFLLQALSGGTYDLVAFDPRGTGNTIPLWCYESDWEVFDAISGISQVGNASDVQLGRQWARAGVDANMCLERAEKTAGLLSTAFGARDLLRVSEAESDGLLRFWGFSYGTTLGATAAAMFADKVEKMILDGVQNPHEYYHAHSDYEEWTDSDKVFSGIFSGCVANPSKCALAQSQPDATAEELEAQAYAALEGLKREPLALGTIVLDYSALKGLVAANLYGMEGWPVVALFFDLLIRGDLDTLEQLLLSLVGGASGGGDGEDVEAAKAQLRTVQALFGIHCGERTVRAATFDAIEPAAEKLFSMSRILADASSSVLMTCARWKVDARERYEGGFDVRTKEPVLVIGNRYDAHTPLVSARNVSAGLEGSALLEVNGYGHASLSPPSLCTLKTTAAYWVNGTLPEPGTVCEVEGTPFSGVTWADVIAAAAGNSSALARRDDIPYIPDTSRIFNKGGKGLHLW